MSPHRRKRDVRDWQPPVHGAPELNEEAPVQMVRTGFHVTFTIAAVAVGFVISTTVMATWAWADIKHDVAGAQLTAQAAAQAAGEAKSTAADHTKQLGTINWKINKVMDKLGIYREPPTDALAELPR